MRAGAQPLHAAALTFPVHGLKGVLAAVTAGGTPDLKQAMVLVALVLPLVWLVALDRWFRRKR